MHKSLFLFLVVLSQLIVSCHFQTDHARDGIGAQAVNQLQSDSDYHVDKRSPNSTYRVRIDVGRGPKKGTRDYTELGSYQFYRGQELICAYNWEDSDQYEPTFRERIQKIEWVTDNILRMGGNDSHQPFFDEIILENRTDEILKYVTVGYGKSELFWVLDLKPGDRTILQGSPSFKSDGTSNYFVGYGGMTLSGRDFEGTTETKQRKSAVTGPLRFAITISSKDLR